MMANDGHIAKDTLFGPERLEARAIDWDQSNRGHSSGRAANVLQSRRGIHGRNRYYTSINRKTLALRAPSIHGPSDRPRASLDRAPVWDDVATFDGHPWRGAVDIVTAGYPCQPFSVAGKRRGTADARHLWPHVARIIGEVAPPFVFLENVAHHLRLGFPEVASGLVGMGYCLAAGLFTAAEVGAPHKRERLFILAIREGDELADPARLLWHPVEWREPDGIAAALADAEGQREREPADEAYAVAGSRPARHEPGDHGRALADAYGERWLHAECRQPPVGRSDAFGRDVDDADGAGTQGWGDDAGEHGGERPSWPPGPGDADGWAEYLRCAPNLEPAVRRGADGLAHRVDRLRLCGNGVAPLVAAHALRTLAVELLADG